MVDKAEVLWRIKKCIQVQYSFIAPGSKFIAIVFIVHVINKALYKMVYIAGYGWLIM